MATHNELGKTGEKYAQEYLLSKGYKIHHVNWKSGNYELDIIAEKDNILIVAEVKTRSNNFFGNPEEFVSKAKIKRIITAAHYYVCDHNINMDTRFDIIGILKSCDGNYKIEHFEDAFMAIRY